MVRKATGASYPAVSDRMVWESKIPLPSLAEQRRIAAILDKADALRARGRAAFAQFDALTQSIFLDMFGNPKSNPKGWPGSKLGEVTRFLAGSTLPDGVTFMGQENGYFLAKVSDMNLDGTEAHLTLASNGRNWRGRSCMCPAGIRVIRKTRPRVQ